MTESNQTPETATATAAVPTLTLDVASMAKDKADLEDAQERLELLAENTNGEFILPLSPDEMELKAPLVARMIDASYVVTYMPKIPVVESRGIAERVIDVMSKRPGLIVQARRKLLIDSTPAKK